MKKKTNLKDKIYYKSAVSILNNDDKRKVEKALFKNIDHDDMIIKVEKNLKNALNDLEQDNNYLISEIDEICESNRIFSNHYKQYEKLKEKTKESKTKTVESPFKNLIQQYSEKGYKIPNLSYKNNNLFEPSALLLENNQIDNFYGGNDTDNNNKDCLFLEKVAQLVQNKISLSEEKKIFKLGERRVTLLFKHFNFGNIKDLKKEYKDLNKYIKEIKNKQIIIDDDKTDTPKKMRMNSTSSDWNLKTASSFRKISLVNQSSNNHSTKFQSLDITSQNNKSNVRKLNDKLLEKKLINSMNKKTLIKPRPIIKSSVIDTLSLTEKSDILDQNSNIKLQMMRDRAYYDSKNSNKETLLEYIYNNRNSRNTNKLINEYITTYKHKKNDEMKDISENKTFRPGHFLNSISEMKKKVLNIDIHEIFKNSNILCNASLSDRINIDNQLNTIHNLNDKIKNLDKEFIININKP